MALFENLFDFILSDFNKFAEYKHIKEFKIPLWWFALVGIFVILVLLWIFLVVYGLKFGIYRFLISGSHNSPKSRNNLFKSTSANRNTSTIYSEGNDERSHIWIHARKPTHEM